VRRTGLALAAISLSVALVLAYTSILRAYSDWIVETMTGPTLGHVQAHAPLWRKDRQLQRSLRDIDRTLAAVRADPDVDSATARLYAPALAASGEEGFAVMVVGLDTRLESGPARLLAEVSAPLADDAVLVGAHLADTMGLHEGDTVAIVGQAVDGSLANDLFRVQRLVSTPVDLVNRQGIVMNLAQAQTLFAMPGEAHELVVHARRPEVAADLATRLRAIPGLGDAEVLDWRALAPDMVNIVQIADIAGTFVLVLVFIAAAAGVANTMLMATFERTREFGMLLALGASPGRVIRLVVTESLVLGLLGALIGSGIGIALVAATHRSGIDYAALTGGGPSELSFAGLRWSLRFYPTLTAIDVLRTVAAVCITSLVASIWPAAKVGRLEPIRALRGT
jgi:ABC-type lipoprotein release transport system permease subunit